MIIKVNPHNCEIEKNPVNEKEINITKCEFEFSEEITDSYVKDVYFTLNDTTIKVANIQNNKCDIPYEVLIHKGMVEIGVVAYLVENEQEIKRYNPSPVFIDTWVGSLKDNFDNYEKITPTDKEQLEQELNDGLQEISEAVSTITTAVEQANTLDLDVSKSGKNATVELTKKDGTIKTVTLSDGTSLEFNWNGTSLGIKTDDDADYTYVDLQGIQGEQGPMGAPFTIKKTYSSVAEMNADFNNMNVGDYVMIASTVEIEDNAKLYTKGEEAWIFITDFSGATGIQGPTGLTPNIQIGTVTSGETPSVTRSGSNENPVLNFTLVKGDTGNTGATGATGNGIASIEKTSTSGVNDLYTITYTNGQTTTFIVTNGEVSFEQLNYYRMIENALPKVTGTGTNITMNNTAESPMKMELEPSELSQGGTPTPSNPQDIHVTTGNNTIKIRNKNIFDKYDSFNYGGTNNKTSLNGLGQIVSTSNYYNMLSNGIKIDVLPNTDYALSGKILEANGTGSNNAIIRVMSVEGNETLSLQRYSKDLSKPADINFTFNTGNYNQIWISFNGSNSSASGNTYTVFDKIQLELGIEASQFKQHQEQSLPLTLTNSLFNINEANIIDATFNEAEIISSNNGKTLYIPITGGNTYKVYKRLSTRFRVATTQAIPTVGVTVSNHIDNANATLITITAPSTAKYLVVYYYLSTSDTLTEQQILRSIRIYDTAEEEINLEYCKIGDYKDEFYKATSEDTSLQEGKWYLKKNTNKIDSYNGETITTTYISTTGGLDTGATIYYGLTTPTYTLLNDTLQTELDNIYEWAKSYQEQTNINQTNADLPFIINSKAIRDMSNIFDLINGE